LRTDCHAVSALYALRRIHRLAILYVNLSGRTVLCTESASDTFFSVYYNHSTSPFLFSRHILEPFRHARLSPHSRNVYILPYMSCGTYAFTEIPSGRYSSDTRCPLL